jgi:hypothetical protein
VTAWASLQARAAPIWAGQQANAHISGSAQIDLAPHEDADISISGSGVVRLHGAVARIHSHVSGSGQIKQVP